MTAFTNQLTPPAAGKIAVAFPISHDVEVIDLAGPWQVFQDVVMPDGSGEKSGQPAFQLFTVSEKIETLDGSGGLKFLPQFTFADAPAAQVIVVPAQQGSAALTEWLRKNSASTDVTMSVCTGAFQLARAGLLSGLTATTHHDFFNKLAAEYPDVAVQRGLRFVDHDRISTAGGLTSGIDLALRVVERFFGRAIAERTAAYMEYEGTRWIA